jgi:Domain of unknown function (DUF222)
VEKLAAAGKVLAARWVEESNLWPSQGFRSAAQWTAAKTGTTVEQAVGALTTARCLEDLPETAEAFRSGRLSETQGTRGSRSCRRAPGGGSTTARNGRGRHRGGPARRVPPGDEHLDHEAFVRGYTEGGETCEVPGVGPIPVSAARRLADDAVLRAFVTDGVDVTAVAHPGRTIAAHLRSALEVRDPVCVVPGCRVGTGLEIYTSHPSPRAAPPGWTTSPGSAAGITCRRPIGDGSWAERPGTGPGLALRRQSRMTPSSTSPRDEHDIRGCVPDPDGRSNRTFAQYTARRLAIRSRPTADRGSAPPLPKRAKSLPPRTAPPMLTILRRLVCFVSGDESSLAAAARRCSFRTARIWRSRYDRRTGIRPSARCLDRQ